MPFFSRAARRVFPLLVNGRAFVSPMRMGALLLVVAVCQTGVAYGQFPDFSNPPPKDSKRNPPATSKPQPTQRTPTQPRATRPNVASQNTAANTKVPAPEEITRLTKDGVTLTCTWFGQKVLSADQPATQRPPKDVVDGRQVAPFILLHDWDRSREDLLLLGRYLQLNGHAAIVPDLRGHGDSLEVAGSTKPLDRDRFKKNDIPAILGDIEACKKFLMRKNDAGEVNIDLLNVVAVGKTGALAAQWVVSDWSWAPVGSVKQGQDVKSLILVAPEKKKFQGMSLVRGLTHPLYVGGPNDPLPLLIVYPSQNVSVAGDGEKIFATVKKARSKYAKVWKARQSERKEDPEAEEAIEGEEPEEEPVDVPSINPLKTLVSGPVPGSTKGGSDMIADSRSQGVFRFIDNFVKQTVLSRRAGAPWQQRLKK